MEDTGAEGDRAPWGCYGDAMGVLWVIGLLWAAMGVLWPGGHP